MASKNIAGGLLSGLGTGMVAQAQSRREAAMARAKALREERRRQEDFSFKREQAETERDFKMSRDEAKAERERGLLHKTEEAEGGELYGITRGGKTKDLGIKAAQKDGGKGGGAGGELRSSDLSLIERISDKVWGKKDADGQFVIPDDASENYTRTGARAEELLAHGVLPLQAGHIAALSIKGPLSKEEARKLAEREAIDNVGDWRDELSAGMTGDKSERDKYIEQRVPELMRDSREAERRYQRIVRGGGDAPSRSGRQSGRSGQDTRRSGPSQPKPQAQSGQKASQAPAAPRDRTARTVGQVYQAPDGRLIEWTGQGWRLVEQ